MNQADTSKAFSTTPNSVETPISKRLLQNVLPFNEVCEVSLRARARGKKVVFTSGTFDILHVAHFHYLVHLKMKGDLLVVGIEDNTTVAERKGAHHPFFDEQERALMVANLQYVDYVFIEQGRWGADTLMKLAPDFVGVPPYDPELDDKLRKIGLTSSRIIITPPYLRGYSSSKTAQMLD